MLYMQLITNIDIISLNYSNKDGIKAVIWMDVLQMGVYISGAILALLLLMGQLTISLGEAMVVLQESGKFQVLNGGFGLSWSEFIADPSVFWIAVFGCAVLYIEFHVTYHLIVQIMLSAGDLRSSQKALNWSGIVASLQFGLFLINRFMLLLYGGGASPESLGLAKGDEIFATFIVD